MKNIQSDPEAFGLRVVGEAEFSSDSYEFDTTILWQDVETGALYVASDSGCSCPIPFESVGRNNLTRIERTQELLDYLDERKKESYNYEPEYNEDECTRIDNQCIALVHAYREAASALRESPFRDDDPPHPQE